MPTSADLRRDLGNLTNLAGAELARIFRDLEAGVFAGEALFDLLPALVAKYGSAAASVTANWYDDARLEQEMRTRFSAIPADIEDSGTGALIGWAQSQTSEPVALESLILGGTTRRILNFSRLTVMRSSIADPGAAGWRRVGDGHSCEFCSMLIGRGAVYSESTADFHAHDHCGCTAEADWR